jgi:hypothetical protein
LVFIYLLFYGFKKNCYNIKMTHIDWKSQGCNLQSNTTYKYIVGNCLFDSISLLSYLHHCKIISTSLKMNNICHLIHFLSLTPKGPRPFLGPFLKFRQVYFLWTCGLVLPSRYTNFYKIPISNLGAMPQKQNYLPVRAAWAAKKLFIF